MPDEAKNAGLAPEHAEPEALSGHFDLLQELGQGSSGTVYRARLTRGIAELQVGTEVAVKFLRRELITDPVARDRLEAEGRLGRQIRSDQVVRIYAVETVELLGMASTDLVMEWIRGRSLREVICDSGSVVEELARRIGIDAAKGLHALHDLGLVHRDIKPENLALTDAGTVKVMDLGLVRQVSRHDIGTASGFYGSLNYGAPEVLLGRAAQPTSDLYSLGVVLFEIVTGQHPFAAAVDHPDEIIDSHLKQHPARPSHFKPRISAFLEELILDLLAKDPKDRPQSAAELVTTLSRGENSRYWIRHERQAPLLASRRRLRNLRRNADVAFVGRRRERRELDGLLRSAMDHRGRAAFLTGPGGIGRRRMLDEWLEDWLARRDDIVFLGGEAKGGGGLQRAAPFTEMLLDWFLRGDKPDSPLAHSRLAARVAMESDLSPRDAEQLAGIISDADTTSSPEERASLLATRILALAPRDKTLVLRVDRAEHFSTTANLVVQRLVDEIHDHRVLLILVSIDGRVPLPGMHHIPLHGLPEADFVALARRMFADRRVPEQLIRRAHTTLAGSPGNLLDAVALLARECKVAGRVGEYRVVDVVKDLRPARSLLDRLSDRVSQLTPEERFVHLGAAVLGHSFPISDLAVLVGQSELAVLEALSVFQGRIILTNRGNGRFRHRDFRKELLKMAPGEARRRLHRTAAWTLEDRGASPLDIGLHLSRAGEHAAAIPPLLAGLQQLTATGSRQGSQKVTNRLRIHFGALKTESDSAASNHDPLYLEFLLLSGRTYEIADRYDRAKSSFEAAASLAEELQEEHAREQAWVSLARLDLEHGRLFDVLKHLDSMSRTALKSQAATTERLVLRAQSHGLRARVHGYLGRSEAALTDIRNALAILPQRDAGDVGAHLHIDLARLEALRHHFVAALKSLERAGRRFDEAGSMAGTLRVLLHQGHILAMIGSKRQASARLNEALDRGRRLSNSRTQAKAQLFLGELSVWHREPVPAIQHLESSVALALGPSDLITKLQASVYLTQLGKDIEGLEEQIRGLGVPFLQIGWCLATAGRDAERRSGLLTEATELSRDVTLPLYLRRRLLYATGKDLTARSMEREIAARMPAGPMRRRFLAFVKRKPN